MSDYKFSKTDGGSISNDQAKAWMKNYKDKHPAKDAVISRFIGTDMVNAVLNQDGCVGFRVYFGYDDAGQIQIFLVGSRADGSNIWPGEAGSGPNAILADGTMPCPPYCPQ